MKLKSAQYMRHSFHLKITTQDETMIMIKSMVVSNTSLTMTPESCESQLSDSARMKNIIIPIIDRAKNTNPV